MNSRLFKATIFIAMALHQSYSFAHDSVLAHTHEWHTAISLVGIGIVFVLLVSFGKHLKR